MAQPESAKKTSSEGVLGVGSGSSTAGGHTSIFHDGRRQRCRDLQLAKHKQKGLASAAMAGPATLGCSSRQGWQGRGGSPTHVPRTSTPGEISDSRPAISIDPGLPARPGHARSGPDMPGPARTFAWIGIIKLCINCNISECLQ